MLFVRASYVIVYENREVEMETDEATGCLVGFQLSNLPSHSFDVLMDTSALPNLYSIKSLSQHVLSVSLVLWLFPPT